MDHPLWYALYAAYFNSQFNEFFRRTGELPDETILDGMAEDAITTADLGWEAYERVRLRK